MSTLSVTFTWPSDVSQKTVELSMPCRALEERDPEGTSILAAKMRFCGTNSFAMEATGPGEEEYMTPELVEFLWEYMKSGSLQVTPMLEGDDCER